MRTSLITFIPAHNEEKNIVKKIEFILNQQINPYEKIIVVENGSTDDTWMALKSISSDRLQIDRISEANQGLAIRRAMQIIESNSEDATWLHFNGADIPFGSSDLESFLEASASQPDVSLFIGSKAHPKSQVNRKFSRSIVSKVFYWIRRAITGMKHQDTQGTLFFKTENLSSLNRYLNTDGFTTTTEIVYWHHINGKKVQEIPVKLAPELRPSTLNLRKILISGWNTTIDLIKMTSRKK